MPTDAAMGIIIGEMTVLEENVPNFQNQVSSDEYGLKYLDQAKVSSRGLAELMRRLASQRGLTGNQLTRYYQTHPGTAERVAIYQDHMNKSPHTENGLSDDQKSLMERLIDKLRAYTVSPKALLNDNSLISASNRDYGMAIALFRHGKSELALKRIDQLISKFNRDPYFHEFRGDILMSLARPADAAAAYEDSLSLKPESAQIRLSLGRALIATNDKSLLQRAVDELERVVQVESQWTFGFRQLAIAYGRSGNIAKADLILAEEAILLNKPERAIQMAKRVVVRPDTAPELKSRANDIIFHYSHLK